MQAIFKVGVATGTFMGPWRKAKNFRLLTVEGVWTAN